MTYQNRESSRKNDISSVGWGTLDDPLASRWTEFVNCPVRLILEGPFLKKLLLRQSLKILDAAMGIACEATFLASVGCKITGNEISPPLRKLAKEHAERQGVNIHVTAVDWRDLAKEFGHGSFDIVIVLGNSLCLLRDPAARREAASNFRAVCAKGGALVIDSRNFDYILNNRGEILQGNFRFSGNIMYCGSSVTGRPVRIDDNSVRFAYKDTKTDITIGYLDMYPFRQGEMESLLRAAGFEKLEVYSDFSPGFSSEADFFTYIFR